MAALKTGMPWLSVYPCVTRRSLEDGQTSISVLEYALPERIVAEDLADALATKLTISGSKGKQKAAPEMISKDDLRISATWSVNSASQELSNVVCSGWKKALFNFSKTTLSNTESSALTAEENLCVLRRICLQDMDVERAAVSVLGKLVTLYLVSSNS